MNIRPVVYRIQKQALELASHEFEDAGMGGIARFNELFVEKFSELIVEECMNIIEEVSDRHSGPYIDAAMRDAVFEISQRFLGVNNERED